MYDGCAHLRPLYGFILCMWALMLLGGGIAVTILGPVSISGFGDFDQPLSSAIKGMTAIGLVALWIAILSKMKKWMFSRMVQD